MRDRTTLLLLAPSFPVPRSFDFSFIRTPENVPICYTEHLDEVITGETKPPKGTLHSGARACALCRRGSRAHAWHNCLVRTSVLSLKDRDFLLQNWPSRDSATRHGPAPPRGHSRVALRPRVNRRPACGQGVTPAGSGLDPLARLEQCHAGSENSVTEGCVGLVGYYFSTEWRNNCKTLIYIKKKIQRHKGGHTRSEEVQVRQQRHQLRLALLQEVKTTGDAGGLTGWFGD